MADSDKSRSATISGYHACAVSEVDSKTTSLLISSTCDLGPDCARMNVSVVVGYEFMLLLSLVTCAVVYHFISCIFPANHSVETTHYCITSPGTNSTSDVTGFDTTSFCAIMKLLATVRRP